MLPKETMINLNFNAEFTKNYQNSDITATKMLNLEVFHFVTIMEQNNSFRNSFLTILILMEIFNFVLSYFATSTL